MTSPLKMTVYRPAGRLGLYVRAFQVFSATDPPAGVSVLDFGGGDVSVPVCFGDPVLVEDWDRGEVPSTAVVGPRRHAVWLRFQGRVDQVNVSFFPGAAGAFVGLPMSDFVNRMASPDDVWPHDFREAVAELQPLPAEQRISGLADLLLARLEPRREPPRQVREAVRLIRARRGRVAVRLLASQVNLSISQLERGFTRHVGVGPKLLARQTRVCALAAEATTLANPGWALLAARYGYADQAHLAREFRELTGLTPSSLARAARRPIFFKTPWSAVWESSSLRLKKSRRRSMPGQPILMPGIRLAAIAPVSTASSQNHLVKGERECQASTNHRLSGLPAPMWRRGAKRTGTRHAACSPPMSTSPPRTPDPTRHPPT